MQRPSRSYGRSHDQASNPPFQATAVGRANGNGMPCRSALVTSQLASHLPGPLVRLLGGRIASIGRRGATAQCTAHHTLHKRH